MNCKALRQVSWLWPVIKAWMFERPLIVTEYFNKLMTAS
jgi:hypothetical protein